MEVSLKEWKKQEFASADLDAYAREIHDSYSKYIDVSSPPFGNGWLLQAKGYVGYLPFSGGVIKIEPKVPIENLFGMLDVAYGLKSFKVLEGLTSSSSLRDFFSRLASILGRRVLARSRKGLFRSYCLENDLLGFVRGRIDVRESLRNPLSVSVHCSYEDHTTDVFENKLILWTLSSILRSGLCRSEYLPVVRHAYRILGRFSSCEPYSHTDCIGRLYNRLNDDYEPMHGLCRFFLERMGPSQGMSDRKMLPFVISMHQLFEEFVARWLAEKLREDGRFSLSVQLSLDAGSYSIFPDLVVEDIETGKPLLVADTKYKIGEKVSPDDVNQVLAYSMKLNCSEAILIYPFVMADPYGHDWRGTNVACSCFDLSKSIKEGGELLLAEIIDKCTRAKFKQITD